MKNQVLAIVLPFLLATSSLGGEIDFPHQIVPILRTNCMKCHVGGSPEGDFSINTRLSLIQSTQFVERVTSDDPNLRMPPVGETALSEHDQKLLTQWFESGAPWTSGFTFDGEVYETPLRPREVELPDAIDANEHPIDRILDNYLFDLDLDTPEKIADAAFLRRAHLDLNGLLPTADQTTEFLDDQSATKRTELIDQLLSNDTAYAEHWIVFWNDSLGNDYDKSHPRKQISQWLYESLLTNKPYDQFARELIAPPESASVGFAGGSEPKISDEFASIELQYARHISQTFLGINLKCASCHDSYLDNWTLQEAFSLAAIGSTRDIEIEKLGKSTGELAKPAWLFPELGKIDDFGPRRQKINQLSRLITDPQNGRFARTIVNRLWAQLMGRGIVHPATTLNAKPFSEDLLDLLANHFVENDYDLKSVLRLIATSNAYATAASGPINEDIDFRYAGPVAQSLTAEQFLDAIWSVTQSPPKSYDAPFLRTKGTKESDGPNDSHKTTLSANWIWGEPYSRQSQLADGSTFVVRKSVQLPSSVRRGLAFVCADNSFELYVNGQFCASSENWTKPQTVLLRDLVHEGKNEFVIVVHEHFQEREKSAVIFEARLELDNGDSMDIVSDDSWDVMRGSKILERTERLGELGSVQSSAHVFQRAESYELITEQAASQVFARYALSKHLPIRASLLQNNELMRALGRPDRARLAPLRPSGPQKLESVDWNEPTLAKALSDCAERLAEQVDDNEREPDDVISHVFLTSLSRLPTKTELTQLAADFDSEKPTESVKALLQNVFAKPEFMMVR